MLIKYVKVGGRLRSTANSDNPANNHIVTGAESIYDDDRGKTQSEINAELYNALQGGGGGGGDNPSTCPDLEEINQQVDGLDNKITEIEEILSDILLEKEQAEQEEYVDLGLPSGTLWAKYNVGASRETECGNYYTYGSGINTYDSSLPSYYSGAENPLPINVDTAALSWGTQWHTPTKELFEELLANTTYDIVAIDGIGGIKLTANNGKYLFFPGSGWWSGSNYMGIDNFSYYWSSTPYDDNNNAYIMSLDQNHGEVRGSFRRNGFNIRPVLQYTIPTRLVEIDSSGKLKKSDKKTSDFVQTTQNLKTLVIEKADYEALRNYDRDTLYFILEPIEGSVFATPESSRGEIDGFPLILN